MELKRCGFGAGFALLFASSLFFFGAGFAMALLVSAAAHEAGHFAAMAMCGLPVTGIFAGWGGVRITYGARGATYMQEAAVAASGPLASLFFAVVAAAAGRYFSWQWAYLAAGMSLAYCVLNMLPASVLDGGCVLYAFISHFVGDAAAERCAAVTDMVVCALLFALGMAVAVAGNGNVSLIICAGAAAGACCKRRRAGVKF